jgi:hypothetical protein
VRGGGAWHVVAVAIGIPGAGQLAGGALGSLLISVPGPRSEGEHRLPSQTEGRHCQFAREESRP